MGGFAWVTLATNDSYSLGALVLAHSLRRVNTAHQLVVLITPGVTEAMRTQLSAVFNVVKLVDVLDSGDAENLSLLARPELGITFTKLHCWKLTQYDKCVFLDADTLVLQNSDELFEREELSAAPDAGWPDCFNSGVFVYQPSDETFKAIIEFALIHGSFDGGDQGLLNLFFSDWPTKDIKKHLPFVYNMCSTATYSYLPAFKQFGQGLKIIHFIGAAKPWLQPFNTESGLARVSGESQHITQFVQFWWDLFCNSVHPSLSTEMAGLAGALASVTLGSPLTSEQSALEEHLRRQGWEQGNIDYMGKDSFANIWQKICTTLSSNPPVTEEAPAPVAPVAAPVYVSSVEISPTGPIDTSPPANYAPVSAIKTTVEASNTEVAAKAAPAETSTVVLEPKSPSVTEIASKEASNTPSSPLETSIQPSAPIPEVSKEPPSTVQPASSVVDSTVVSESTPTPVTKMPSTQAETPPSPLPVIPLLEPLQEPINVVPTPPQTPPEATASVTSATSLIETSGPQPLSPVVPTEQTPKETSPIQKTETPISSEILVATAIKSPDSTSTPPISASSPAEAQVFPTGTVVEPSVTTPAEVVAPLPAIPIATETNVVPPPVISESVAAVLTTPPSQTQVTCPQPGTPTVTEPTPPTSPPATVVEAGLELKLQVDTEVPGTPPVGSTSTQPSLAAAATEEPPIPPKRKGGSRGSQESKNQKGGKQTKGKK